MLCKTRTTKAHGNLKDQSSPRVLHTDCLHLLSHDLARSFYKKKSGKEVRPSEAFTGNLLKFFGTSRNCCGASPGLQLENQDFGSHRGRGFQTRSYDKPTAQQLLDLAGKKSE